MIIQLAEKSDGNNRHVLVIDGFRLFSRSSYIQRNEATWQDSKQALSVKIILSRVMRRCLGVVTRHVRSGNGESGHEMETGLTTNHTECTEWKDTSSRVKGYAPRDVSRRGRQDFELRILLRPAWAGLPSSPRLWRTGRMTGRWVFCEV